MRTGHHLRKQHGSACSHRVAAKFDYARTFLVRRPERISSAARNLEFGKRSEVQRAVNIQNAPRAPVHFCCRNNEIWLEEDLALHATIEFFFWTG